MVNMIYEIHSFSDPLLPFIFHKRCSATQKPRYVNWHDSIEILLCTEGQGTVHCGGKDLPFQFGDIFVVNPDTPHTLSSATKVRYQCLIVDSGFENLSYFSRTFRRHMGCLPSEITENNESPVL